MKHLKLIPLALVAALSACHNGGVGVDSGASQQAATAAENGLKSDRGIASHTAAAASIQMPAAPLMINALTDLAKASYLPPKSAAAASGPLAGIDMRSLIWSGAMEAPMGVSAAALTGKPSPAGSKAGGDGIDASDAQTFGLLPIAASAHPWQGWPFNCFGCAKEAAWARGMARQVVFTNLMLTQLYPALGTQALADPQAAQQAVQAAWKKLPVATILAAWKEAGDQVKGGINFDFTGSGPAPVHFMIGNNDFQGSPTGWRWSQSGVVWFGDGAISGRQVSLGLESAIDKSSSQTSGTGTSNGSSTEQGAGGSAGVK